MVSRGPPIASGCRGSRRITTLEEYYGPAEQTNKNKSEYRKCTEKNGGTTHVATNLILYLNPIIPERDPKGSRNGNGHRSHRKQWISAKEHHACRGVAGQNLKLLNVLGPSQNSLILALGTSIGGLDHLYLNLLH